MMASQGFLTILVTVALILTAVAPITLLILLVRDWTKGKLW